MDESHVDPAPRSRGGLWRVDVVVVVGAIAVLGAGFWWFGPGSADDSSPPDSSPTVSPPTAAATELAEFETTCTDPKPQPDAARYRGDGPHRFVAFDGDTTSLDFTSLTPDWVTDDPGEVELIVCVDAKFDKVVNTCELRDNDHEVVKVKVMAFDYTFRIFQAATGDLLDEQVEHADDPTCPTSVLMDPEATGWSVESPTDDDHIREILRPWVTGPVG